MNTRILPFLFVAFALLLGGCITIEENYTFDKKGGGTMTYVLDMSEMGKMLKSFGEDGKDKGKDEGDKMSIATQAEALKNIAGVSKVKLDTHTEWVQKLSFSFADIAALNRALNALMPDSTGGQHTFFSKEGNTLVRTSNNYIHLIASSMSSEGAANAEEGEEEDGTGLDINSMLGMMKYKYSFSFKQAVENTEASSALVKEKSGTKEVKYSTDWAAIAKDPTSLDLRIALKGK